MKVELKYLRKEKAQEMSLSYQKGIEKHNELRVEIYDDATIFPGKYLTDNQEIGGGVIDKEGNFIELSGHPTYDRGIYNLKKKRE